MSDLDHALDELTDKQYNFWELMQSGKFTQVVAYRSAFNPSKDRTDKSISTDASRLWNSPRFILVRTALTNGITSQTIKTKETRIAEMQAFANRCEAAKQFGAAGKARELVGKLEGHYVDKTENINRTRDQLQSLKEIADRLGAEKALELAAQVGMEDQLAEHLASLH